MATPQQLAESTRVAQEAAKLIGGTFEQGKGFTPGSTPTSPSGDALLGEIRKKLVKNAEAVSSVNTGLEDSIKRAIGAVNQGTQAESQRIGSVFDREIDFATGQAQNTMADFSETRTGFGTQMVALRNLVDTTDKNLKDLQQRKEELILQNNAAGAQKIADLEMKAIEYRQQATQQVFQNLLGVANFDLNRIAENRATTQFKAEMEFRNRELAATTEARMADLAAEFGVSIEDGDTLQDIVRKVAPIASRERNARLSSMLKDIETETTQANFDTELMDILATPDASGNYPTAAQAANMVLQQRKELGVKMTNEEYNLIYSRANDIYNQIKTRRDSEKAQAAPGYLDTIGIGFQDIMRRITQPSKSISEIEKSLGLPTQQDDFFSSLFQS